MSTVPNQDKWRTPQPVTGPDIAFGGDMGKLLPSYETLPEEFRKDLSPWCRVVNTWFYNGLDSSTLTPKSGIDKRAGLLHLKAIMASWEPKHEHKTSGVAYLMSLWFERVP